MISLIGHSNWKIDDFVGHLKKSGINILVDVRSKPYSRYCPQYNTKALRQSVVDAGIDYKWRGEKLGGLQQHYECAATMDALGIWSEQNPRHQMVLMCSERPPQECHRFYWLANYLAHTAPSIKIRSLTVGQADWFPELKDYPELPAFLSNQVKMRA